MQQLFFIARQPAMAVRMATPINQLSNDESIAVQNMFGMFIREISHGFRWNTGLIGDGSEFQ